VEALAQWRFFQKHRSFAVDLVLPEERVNYMQELKVSLGMQRKETYGERHTFDGCRR
jgi:hypothetical protein